MTVPDDRLDRERAIRTMEANLVVTAGAGTGKTALLVKRLVALVVRDPDPLAVTDLVALTFTNKAAAELIVRFREGLESLADAADETGSDSHVVQQAREELERLVAWTRTSMTIMRARLRAALRDLDRAHLGTIHGFAATLLRLFPIEAGVDPRFAEADEARWREHVAAAWPAWLSRELRGHAPRADLWRRVLERASLDELFTVACGLCAESIPLGALAALSTAPPQADDWLAGSLRDVRELLASHPERRKIEQQLAAAERILQAAAEGRWTVESADEEAVEDDVRSAPKGWNEADTDRAKALVKVARLLATVDHETIARVGEALAPFIRECRAAFQQAGFVPFDGLLTRARDLVRDHRHVREALKGRFRALLIDECQDTDPIQYEILFFLAEEPGCSASDWRSVRLQRGKLFIVGDPKQSIYGFRGADIEAYQSVVQAVLDQGGIQCTLSTNFRSRGAILSAVNAVGERLITYRPGLQDAYVPIVPVPEGAGGPLRPMVRIVRSRGAPFGADAAREAEADDLARWLAKSVFGRVEVRGRDGPRPAALGDTAILLRALTGVHVYIEALRRRGIPYVVEGERRFFAAQEVVDAINVLRALASPYDRVALVGVLRSPLGGMTDRELYELSRAGWLDYRVVEIEQPPAPWAPVALYRELSALSREIQEWPVDEAVAEIFERLPIEAVAASGPHGEQAAANVGKVVRIAETLAAEGLSFSGLVDRLDRRVRDEVEEGDSPLVDEAMNAVKVLSVHKAKGLEFPIVVLAGAHAGSNYRNSPAVLRHWSSGTVGLQVGDTTSLAVVYLGERLAAREAEEARRVLYVGMTRARDLLVISGAATARAPRDGAAALIADALGVAWGESPAEGSAAARAFEWHVVETDTEGEPAGRPGERVQWPDREVYLTGWRARWERAARIRRTPRFLTPTTLASGDASVGQERTASPRPRAKTDAGRARRLGVLAHGFLQQWDYYGAAASWPSALERYVARAAEDVDGALNDVGAILAPFFSSDLYRDLAASRILGREVPLIMPWKDAIMEGVIDLIYEREGRLYVADYKSDDIAPDEAPAAADRYTRQAEVYTRAVRESMGREVAAFRCIFLRLGLAVDLPAANPARLQEV